MKHITRTHLVLGCIALASSLAVQAQDTVRLGNLKFAHYGAVSYIKEIAPNCGIKVEERVFAKGPDIMQAIMAGELDAGAAASESAISARANGAPIYVVAGFAKGGARLVARQGSGIKSVNDLKGKKVGVTRGGIHEILLAAELAKHGLTMSEKPGKDVQIIYLAFADLNQALLGKNLDAIMQSEPQSSQAMCRNTSTSPVSVSISTTETWVPKGTVACSWTQVSSAVRPGWRKGPNDSGTETKRRNMLTSATVKRLVTMLRSLIFPSLLI